MSKLEGVRQGEMFIISSGRQIGKSVLAEQYMANWDKMFNLQPKFEIIDKSIVDGVQWYTVRCKREVSTWVRTMESKQWYEHIDNQGYLNTNIFDMTDKLYTMLGMKFS